MLTTEKAKPRFLELITEGATIVSAAEEIGFSRTSLYNWRRNDPEFAQAWEDAYDQGSDALEAEAQRRAVDGTEKPVTVAGKREIVREYSDTLLIFLLKARRPARFRDNHRVELSGPDSGPVEVVHRARLTLGDLARFAAESGGTSEPGGDTK